MREESECSLLCFTETWLLPDLSATVRRFFIIQADRDAKLSSKKKQEETVVLVNERWCNPGHVHVGTSLVA